MTKGTLEQTKLDKHFLDTSAARPLLLGSVRYRGYLTEQIGEQPYYISLYVQMEIRRSFIRAAVAFHTTLQLPTIDTIADALALWANYFKPSDLKAIQQLTASLVETHLLDVSKPADKAKALTALGNYIIRFESKVRRSFRDASKDTTHCTRGLVPMPFYADDLSRGLEEFADNFDDTEHCRANCSIDHVLLRRYSIEVKRLVEIAQGLKESDETRGFLAVSRNLEKILLKGPAACSCFMCGKIGDAVIALDAPREMQLEHLDSSFNQLCPALSQPHRQHASELAFHRDA